MIDVITNLKMLKAMISVSKIRGGKKLKNIRFLYHSKQLL